MHEGKKGGKNPPKVYGVRLSLKKIPELYTYINLSNCEKEKIMDFPPNWDIFPMADFTTAGPRSAGVCGMEMMAQVRPNGRILDHYRISLGGSRILDIRVPLNKLNICGADSTLRLRYQEWPRDVEVRRNMVSSTWRDVYDLLASKKADVVNPEEEPVPMDQFLREMKEAGRAAALRFAVIIGEDQRVQLQLQGLPASAASLMGKPAFRG